MRKWISNGSLLMIGCMLLACQPDNWITPNGGGDEGNNGNGGNSGDGKIEETFDNGYQYVDMGLSVKWATLNVGATKPEESGLYYAWGETEPKVEYYWMNYKYANGAYNKMTKYCVNEVYGNNGYTDNKTVLEPEDDVAHVKWGGAWRMPTKKEWIELIDNCTWKGTTLNGIKGYKITNKINSNYIFLPAAGLRKEKEFFEVGSDGCYWSGSLEASIRAYTLHFHFHEYMKDARIDDSMRRMGLSVRPVHP